MMFGRYWVSMLCSLVLALAVSAQLYAKGKSCTGLKQKACSANKACVWKENACAKGSKAPAKKSPKKAKKSKPKAEEAPAPTPDAEDLNNLPELNDMDMGDGDF